MSKNLAHRILIDTNVLINDFFYRELKRPSGKQATDALTFLAARKRYELFVASFSIVQVLSTLTKARIREDLVRAEINRLLTSYTLVSFGKSDIENALTLPGADLEDAFQYEVSQKMRCFAIVTDNTKDYRPFANVVVVKPRQIRQLSILK